MLQNCPLRATIIQKFFTHLSSSAFSCVVDPWVSPLWLFTPEGYGNSDYLLSPLTLSHPLPPTHYPILK
jgi:hypothetical protein